MIFSWSSMGGSTKAAYAVIRDTVVGLAAHHRCKLLIRLFFLFFSAAPPFDISFIGIMVPIRRFLVVPAAICLHISAVYT